MFLSFVFLQHLDQSTSLPSQKFWTLQSGSAGRSLKRRMESSLVRTARPVMMHLQAFTSQQSPVLSIHLLLSIIKKLSSNHLICQSFRMIQASINSEFYVGKSGCEQYKIIQLSFLFDSYSSQLDWCSLKTHG